MGRWSLTQSQPKHRLLLSRAEVSANLSVNFCVAGNAFPMKSTKLVPLMAAAVGASIALAPSDAKAVVINFNIQGSPVGNNSINNPTNTILTVGAGTTITSATPPEYLAPLQAAIAGFTGTFTTGADIFATAPTSISFAPDPYTTPSGETINFDDSATTTGYNSAFQATGVVNWGFTLSGGSVLPAGTTGSLDLSFLDQGAGTFSWTGFGTLNAPDPDPVPGPLPLLGAGAAFGWTRRLRKRLATGSRQG